MSRIISIDPDNPDSSVLSAAATLIRRGGLVAYPTDTTYGIAADPFNEKAVSHLFRVKNRPLSKPILLLINDIQCLHSLVHRVSPLAKAVIKRYWPGPLTLVFQASTALSPALTADTGKIGLRLPAALLPCTLIRMTGFPLTATSANLSGEPSPVTAQEVERMIGDNIDLVLDGGLCEALPSTLLDLSDDSPKIVREGKVPADSLEAFFNYYNINLHKT